jgi:hypothetical protein
MENMNSNSLIIFNERAPALRWAIEHGDPRPEMTQTEKASPGKIELKLAHAPELPVPPLHEAIPELRLEPGALISLFSGILSVLVFILGFASSTFFYPSFVFALLSTALGIYSYSHIRSDPLSLKGSRIALVGALLGSLALAVFLGWFMVNGLNVSVDVLRQLTATAIA